MVAALLKLTLSTNVIEEGGGTLSVPLVLTGNTLEKGNYDIAPNSTVNLSLPFPLTGLEAIVLAAVGTNLTVTPTHDDEDETGTPIVLIKGQPWAYVPSGTIPSPFDSHGIKQIAVANADLIKPAVLHLRLLRDAVVVDD